jgi:hypothetical protein
VTTPSDRLLGPLLDALLAARTQPAADQFDDLVAASVAAGTLPPDLARQLRYWQRASVHEVCDHVRTVLPAVLPTALAAVTASAEEASAGATSAAQVWSGRNDEPPAPPVEDVGPAVLTPTHVPATPQAVLSGPDVIVLPATADDPVRPLEDTDLRDTDEADEDRSRQHARRRLFVAGLTSTA